jgi:AraC-like DNA-binding protein
VIVVCFLSPQQLAHVKRTFPPPHSVTSAATWDALMRDIERRRCDVAIVDPCAGGDHLAANRLGMLERASTIATGVPVVGYLSVTVAGMRAVHSLARFGASDFVIRGVDDSADALTGAVHRAFFASTARRVVSVAGARFAILPGGVARALELAFRHPQCVRSVGDLAKAARITRRSLDRWLARAGLSSARLLLSCARANAAFHLLADGSVRAAEAASLVGYTSTRSLTRELSAIAGRPASAIPARLSREAFDAALERRLVRGSTRNATPPSADASSY